MKKLMGLYTNVYKKEKLMLLTACLTTTIFSCSKKDFQETAKMDQNISLATSVNPNLIYQEDFEGTTYFPESGTAIDKTEGIENCNDGMIAHGTQYDWTLSSRNVGFQGIASGRFEVQKGQPLVGSSQRTRSEITVIKGTEDSRFTPNIWYGFAMMIPTVGGEPGYRTAINQWFEDGSKEATLRTDNGKCYLELETSGLTYRYDLFSSAKTSDASNTGFVNHPLDKWHEFTFHFIHSFNSDGLIEIYRDGVKIHTHNGPNLHLQMPKWKMGLYTSTDRNLVPSKVIYFDNIKVGKSTSTIADMISNPTDPTTVQPAPTVNIKPTAAAGSDIAITLPVNSVSLSGKATDSDGTISATTWSKISGPSQFTFNTTNTLTPTVSNLASGVYVFRLTATDDKGATATDDVTVTVNAAPATGTAPVTSFTFVNAETEKDILTITDGATYSLKQMGVSKLNIRANASSTTGSVRFELTGAQSKSSKDVKVPFALMGDDGLGNYYFGNWNPPPTGSYTLKTTPYVSTTASGTAGTATTIHFSITN